MTHRFTYSKNGFSRFGIGSSAEEKIGSNRKSIMKHVRLTAKICDSSSFSTDNS